MKKSRKIFTGIILLVIIPSAIYTISHFIVSRLRSTGPSSFENLSSQISNISPTETQILYDKIKNLPIIEVPATNGKDKKSMVLWITGDGGWGDTDKGISNELANHGIPVIGLNSLRYFAKQQSPESVANDISNLLYYYLSGWKKEKIVLIGYSFGADVMPFVVNRLPEDLRARVDLLTLIGPAHSAPFALEIESLKGKKIERYPVLPELTKLSNIQILCFYGLKEKDTLCADQNFPKNSHIISHPGDHVVGTRYQKLLDVLLPKIN